MSRTLLAAAKAAQTVIGRKHSPQKATPMATKRVDPQVLTALIDSLSNLSNIKEIQIGGIDGKNLIKLQSLIDGGRDFTSTKGEMQNTIKRFLKALFQQKKAPTQAEIDEVIEDAIIAVIALRLRTGGGDVKGSFRPLTQRYLDFKRKKYPNSKGIGWATGELAHDWAEYGNVRVVR